MAANLDQIVESYDAERLATGFEFTEGPLWHPDGYLLFVNNRINVIYRLVPGGEPEVVRDNSGGANGLTFDLENRIIMCDGDDRQMTRWEHDGSITVLADRWEGKRLHRPNDVVVRSDGSIYFTNPWAAAPAGGARDRLPRYPPHRARWHRDRGDHRPGVAQRPGVLARREHPVRGQYAAAATNAPPRRSGARSARTSTSAPTT